LPTRLKSRKQIHELLRELQLELEAYIPNIVICGESPCDNFSKQLLTCDICSVDTRTECMYHLRQMIKQRLNEESCLATIIEEDEDVAYASMDEKLILRKADVDLVIVIPTSEGSISELSSFAEDYKIRPKLRVLVPYEYHPFYGLSESYVTSVYAELLAEYGHVYPFGIDSEVHPDPLDVVSTLVSVYKRRKLLELNRRRDNNS
jgi:hypothetical protein